MKVFILCIVIGLWHKLACAGIQRFEGEFAQKDLVEIADPIFDSKSLPLISVYFSNDSGSTWYQEVTTCAKVFGTYDSTATFTVVSGTLRLHKNYCTYNATNYQVVIYK